MTLLALIRHGETAWNAEGRIQGRADVALSPEGIAELRALRVPPMLRSMTWITGPLRRAAQTAELLHGDAQRDGRLMETDWGAWEGLESRITHPMAAKRAERGLAGLDFRPPGGESPRDVQRRLKALLAELGAQSKDHVGVTHKGVIRAALSLATGWDMLDTPPVKLRWRAAHLFAVSPDGALSLQEANVMLMPAQPPA